MSKSGDTLKIGLKPHLGVFGTVTLKAKVTLPTLTGVELSGATSGKLSGFDSGKRLDVRGLRRQHVEGRHQDR